MVIPYFSKVSIDHFHRVFNLPAHMGGIDFDMGVPSCLVARQVLPKF